MISLTKYGIYRAELPVQNVAKRDGDRLIETTGSELHGSHRCVVVAASPDDQFAVVCPMTSAQDGRGAEKWRVIKKSWLRVYHQDKPVYILTEQVRYLDATRFNELEGQLGEYDSDQLDLKLKVLLGLV